MEYKRMPIFYAENWVTSGIVIHLVPNFDAFFIDTDFNAKIMEAGRWLCFVNCFCFFVGNFHTSLWPKQMLHEFIEYFRSRRFYIGRWRRHRAVRPIRSCSLFYGGDVCWEYVAMSIATVMIIATVFLSYYLVDM